MRNLVEQTCSLFFLSCKKQIFVFGQAVYLCLTWVNVELLFCHLQMNAMGSETNLLCIKRLHVFLDIISSLLVQQCKNFFILDKISCFWSKDCFWRSFFLVKFFAFTVKTVEFTYFSG